MIRNIVKISLLTLVAGFTAITAHAQIGYDYTQYNLGASIGFNSFYGDTQTSTSTNAFNIQLDYNQTPFVNYIAEFQAGKLAGGDSTHDVYGRQFSTDYTYFAFRVQVQAGEIMDYSQSQLLNALKNFYIGGGIGVIYGTVKQINRYSIAMPGYYTPGPMSSNQLFFPARVGYEFKIFNKYDRPDFKIDVGYQCNFIFGDNIDGFKAGAHNDIFSQFTIGLKYAIGGVTSYRKPIRF
ncbi:MAG: hypothetical protein JST19_12955 [Bacteroidetes bacterium]|nr:hypothetical protein [Bacteroidota bacterium]